MEAARQWGALTGAQARKAGLSQHQIDHRVRTKRWRRAATQDVFVLAGTRDTWEQQAMVACLAGPPGTVTSHLTAAAVVRARQSTRRSRRSRSHGKPAVHRITGARSGGRTSRSGDKAFKDRLPCTSPVQTVIDCAELLDDEALCDLVDSALCRKLMQPSRLIRSGRGRVAGRSSTLGGPPSGLWSGRCCLEYDSDEAPWAPMLDRRRRTG